MSKATVRKFCGHLWYCTKERALRFFDDAIPLQLNMAKAFKEKVSHDSHSKRLNILWEEMYKLIQKELPKFVSNSTSNFFKRFSSDFIACDSWVWIIFLIINMTFL